MKMTRRQLNEVVTNYLLSEAEFGSFKGGVNLEFCDLSGLPKLFTALFEPIRSRDTKKLKSALAKELLEAESKRDQRRIDKLNARISELENPDYWTGSDAFAGIFGSATFMGLTKILGPGLTIMTMMTKVDCDHIVNLVSIFTLNVLAPLMGIEGDQLRELEDEIQKNKDKRSESSEGEEGEGQERNTFDDDHQVKIFKSISHVYKDNNILDYEKRDAARSSGKLRLSDYDGKITDMHLDFFELFSPAEYYKFLEDPNAEIPSSAKDNFLNAIKILEDTGHRNFGSFINAFVLATPGTRTDGAVAKILKAANLKNYFKTPDDATKFVKTVFNTMYKEFEFDGFQIFGL